MAPATKPRHSTAPLGLPGSAITTAPSTTAARLRDRIAFGVIFIDSARITSPKPGNSTRMMARIASGVTSRGLIRFRRLSGSNRNPVWQTNGSSPEFVAGCPAQPLPPEPASPISARPLLMPARQGPCTRPCWPGPKSVMIPTGFAYLCSRRVYERRLLFPIRAAVIDRRYSFLFVFLTNSRYPKSPFFYPPPCTCRKSSAARPSLR